MKLNKLCLKDKKIFNQYLALSTHELAAYAFANIYVWKALYDIRWVLIKDSLCVFFCDPLGCFMYLAPLSKKLMPEIIPQVFEVMDKFNKNKDISRIENIATGDLAYYCSLGYRGVEKYPDYLCLQSDIAFYKGNRFKSQRAACNHFIKHCDFKVELIKPAHHSGCLNLFNAWIQQRKDQCSETVYCGMLDDNRKVIKYALANYQTLNLEGIVVKVGKEIKAFSFGYRLNNNIFCIFYEITDLAIKGLAPFIFRQFSQNLNGYAYLNILDDSGIDNLRKTKLAYKPARLAKAYIVTRHG